MTPRLPLPPEHLFPTLEHVFHGGSFQPSLSDLGRPLVKTTFVVVDLETTGGSPQQDRITEIGAVKIRAGEVLGELATLVDPGIAIPSAITALTGISGPLVRGRPPVDAVLPSFLEFSRGAALVAHNSRFDIAFLNAALQRLDYPPLDHPVVCTAQLARRLVGDEVRNRRLGTLAHHFRASTVPVHRALADARATVDVFHALLEGAGSFGVVTLEDLVAFARARNMPLFTSRRKMADDLPARPGVYRFRSASGEVLYVGKATDLRARVRQYFGSDTRRRMREMVREAAAVEHTVTPTAVEAEVLESRLIRTHRPRFNARGKAVRAPAWVTLTSGPWPRLSITRRPPAAGRTALGPLPSSRVARQVVDALQDAFPIRRCTTPMKADTRFAPCALAEIGRCLAPCAAALPPLIAPHPPTGSAGPSDDAGSSPLPHADPSRPTRQDYDLAVDAVAAALQGDTGVALRVLGARMADRAAAGRFEEAGEARDRLAALVTWTTRVGRDRALRAAGAVAASRPTRDGRREVLVERAGWLLGTAVVSVADVAEAVRTILTAPPVGTTAAPTTPPPPEELQILQRWLGTAGVRLEHADEPLAWPVGGGAEGQRAQVRLDGARRHTGRPDAHLAAKRLTRP